MGEEEGLFLRAVSPEAGSDLRRKQRKGEMLCSDRWWGRIRSGRRHVCTWLCLPLFLSASASASATPTPEAFATGHRRGRPWNSRMWRRSLP